MGYWVFDWFDKAHIQTIKDAERALAQPDIVEDIRHQAQIAARNQPKPEPAEGFSLLVGRGLDLAEHVDCIAALCMKCQADHLFRHIWQYFDRIIVQDGVTEHLVTHRDCWESSDKQNREHHKERLLSLIEILLYLRDMGAEPLIEFYRKPSPCNNWQHHAREIGLDGVVTLAEELIPSLAEEAQMSVHSESGNHTFAKFIHPAFENDYVHVHLDEEDAKGKPETEIRRIVAAHVVGRFVAYLATDLVVARQFRSPLGATTRFHSRLLQASEKMSAAQVAFKIELPVLHGVPVKTLIKIRQDEDEHFKRFQDALRRAINERIKIAQSANALQLANQIRQDVIEPELRRIRERLAASEKILNKKTAVGIYLTTLATACGILAGVPLPLAVTGGLVPMITMAGQAAGKYLEEKGDIELKDMYFLWKAITEHSH